MSRLSRTSNSFYEKPSSLNKISFQTKFKIRGSNEYIEKDPFNNQYFIPTQQNKANQSSYDKEMDLSRSFSNFAQNDDNFNRTCSLLSNLNFSHHDPKSCLCSQCNCGRHLCKMHVVKPDLSKSTVYQKSFVKGKSISNKRVVIKEETKSLPKVEMNSTYAFSFKNKDPNFVIKHHPQDQLQFSGPSQNITMYRANFPGNRGGNPYVRPKQFFVRGQFPLKNKRSAYRQSFYSKDGRKSQTGKINDQLRTGAQQMFRQSFYQEKFKQPNPEDYGNIIKYQQKLEINPNFSHQYETQYGHEFLKKQSPICPAKIKAQTRYKDSFSETKDKFNENADFKALSSTFHALSMAPYGQYQ